MLGEQRIRVTYAFRPVFRAAETVGEARVRLPSLMDSVDVSALVLKGVRKDELYLITHGEWKPMAEARHAALVAAMAE